MKKALLAACVVALARNGDLLGMFEGTVQGRITDTARGDSGFGYDPIFVPVGDHRTFAEYAEEEKNDSVFALALANLGADQAQRIRDPDHRAAMALAG